MHRLFTPLRLFLLLLVCGGLGITSCQKDEVEPTVAPPPTPAPAPDTTTTPTGEIDFTALGDTYADLASPDRVNQWGMYNVHDPSIVKDGEYFYCYNTDVAYGHEIRPGVQIRRSKNLVEWEFVGWVFDGLPTRGANFIRQQGAEPFNALWAPYVLQVGSEYRLYYSLSSPTPRVSAIGLATATDPRGPWTEQGLVVTSTNDAARQTNAIDPTVVVTPAGEHYFYYGSAWDGIYYLPLDPATGLAARNGDKGTRIAQRGFTGGRINGNIEGPEIIYHPEEEKYYLFIAYDWLSTKYNTRVGRSDSPEGPFYDYLGNDLNADEDNVPMIVAPYRFTGHGGWQGVSHPAVFRDGDRYFMAHQGRPGVDFYYMVLHVRELFWTEDGWPVASPERYAALEQTPVGPEELAGNWERIQFGYEIVPGYAEEQVDPDFQEAVAFTLSADGTFAGEAANTWSYSAPWLTLKWSDGRTETLHVSRGRDWENAVASTLVFTGLDERGTAVWGKQVP